MRPLISSLATALLSRHRAAVEKDALPASPAVPLSLALALFSAYDDVLPKARADALRPLAVRLGLLRDDADAADALDTPRALALFRAKSAPALEPPQWQEDLARASDLRAAKRDIAIVTTAAIPWMTGTSVNPALRALYLAKDGHRVTLVVPWLPSLDEQRAVFSKGSAVFETQKDQADFILNWARKQVPGASITILFYDGVYAEKFGSILPVGAITDVFSPPHIVKDVCVLEEPEHLTWHHAGQVWTEMFNIVVGVIHTNYVEYAREYDTFGPQRALFLLFLNVWVCRGYCHRIIKLSDAVQEFPNSVTCNVHGVRQRFTDIGVSRSGPFPRGAYFMAKVLWAKGYRDLIDLMHEHYAVNGDALPIDFFGAGPDAPEVQACVLDDPALQAVRFEARVADHTGLQLQGYKVYVNPSKSDVVCTATAEALAMGKLVVCLEHPSNEFFATFPNCFTYRTPAEFSRTVLTALSREPVPLSEDDAYRLTWEAATERFYDATRVPMSKSKPNKVDNALANAHVTLSWIFPQPGEGIRRAKSRNVLSSPTNITSVS